MKRLAFTLKQTPVTLLLLFGAITGAQAGIHNIVTPPPPADCTGCINEGVYLHGSLLYLQSYNTDVNEYDGEWDMGYRGKLGYENDTGLFAEITAFYHDTDFTGEVIPPASRVTGNMEFFYLDATVGDTFHCGELCLRVSGGLRYGHQVFDEDWGGMRNVTDFDGVGPVFGLDVTRDINDGFSIYANFRQSLLFGESDYNGFKTDTLASVTELGAGVQWNFDLGKNDAFVRAGFEGQYWLVDDSHIGLLGGVLTLGATF